MLFMDCPDMVQSAGIAIDASGIAWDRLGGAPAAMAVEPASIFGASAGAALFRRTALSDVAETDANGREAVFDPAFFMYLEDVDLAWRLRLRSWRAVYAPGARVLHAGSASSGEGSPFKNRLLARNKIWVVAKNYPCRPLLRYCPLILAYDLGSIPYRLLAQGQWSALRGRIDACAAILRLMRQRRRIQARRLASWADLRSAMQPVESPWAVMARYRHLRSR
jgi:GT2 family glycosyltransferase